MVHGLHAWLGRTVEHTVNHFFGCFFILRFGMVSLVFFKDDRVQAGPSLLLRRRRRRRRRPDLALLPTGSLSGRLDDIAKPFKTHFQFRVSEDHFARRTRVHRGAHLRHHFRKLCDAQPTIPVAVK